MRRSLLMLAATLAAVIALGSSASARVLTLSELNDMEQHLSCAYETCATACDPLRSPGVTPNYLDHVVCHQCLAQEACGQAPRLWEKDGAAPVTWDDYELAVLEQYYPVCYADADETVVRPMELCPGDLCAARLDTCLGMAAADCGEREAATIDCRDEDFGETCWYDAAPDPGCPTFACGNAASLPDSADLCSDADQDGLPAWIELELAGYTDATSAPVPCTSDADCGPSQVCRDGVWIDAAGALTDADTLTDNDTYCQARPCGTDAPCGFFEVCERVDSDADGKLDAIATCQARAQCDPSDPTGGTVTEPIGEVCDPSAGACVACLYNSHCGSGERCAAGTCLDATRCVSSLDCGGDTPICDGPTGFCVGCSADADCDGGHVCGGDNTCQVACASDLECTADALGTTDGQLCDPIQGHCAACVSDDTCAFDEACVLGSCRPLRCSNGSICAMVDPDANPQEAACDSTLDCNSPPAADACTAFHLEKVAEDDVEVLVHVYYDYTPIPARVLDLFLNYDDAELTLQDARPLTPLQLAGKQLASSHLSDGTLSLSIFDTSGTHPIPTGPIMELVFKRTGVCPTEIAFTDRIDLREVSVAPMQGTDDQQQQLGDDRLWGAPVTLCARSQVTPRLRLWYGFENDQTPLEYSNVATAQELCDFVPECTFEEDPEIKARYLSRLSTLQSGEVLANERIPGVTRDAIYFDGGSDHLRAPVHFEEPLNANAQSYSFSTWFYTEGNSPDELADTPQLLYSHNALNERTAFGLAAVDTGANTANVVLFSGDMLDPRLSGLAMQNAVALPQDGCAQVDTLAGPSIYTVAGGGDLMLRTWHHVGFTLDTDHGSADGGDGDDARLNIYWDGELVGCVVYQQPPNAVACPQFFAGTDVVLHEEGDVLGGNSPEYIYMAVKRTGLYRIERIDPSGLQTTTVIGDTEFSYRDPDYSPIIDRLLYSSNVSGAWEIWIANGDGSNRRQLSVEFGDASRGITARRPRWAPDGSGIVFDSNIFDVLADDNTFGFVRHVYFMGYDPVANEVAVELADGSITQRLDYLARLADQTILDHRLTTAQNRQHKNARWLTGRDASNPTRARGALLIDVSDIDLSGHRVQLLTIPDAVPLASTETLPGLGDFDEIRLLDAFHSERVAFPQNIVTQQLLMQRELTIWEPDANFVVNDISLAGSPQLTLELQQVRPYNFDPQCWDADDDNVRDDAEDTNGDGEVNLADCSYTEATEPTCWDANGNGLKDIGPAYSEDGNQDGVVDFKDCEFAPRPDGFDHRCWDTNFNGDRDGDEDRNGDELWDTDDCFAPVQDVYVPFDDARYDPVLELVQPCSVDRDCPGGTVCAGRTFGPKRCELASTSSAHLIPCDFYPCRSGLLDTAQICASAADLVGPTLKAKGTDLCVGLVGTVLACVTDTDCFSGQICNGGECKVIGSVPQGCQVDTDCAAAYVCEGGRCLEDPASECDPDAGVGCAAGLVCDASVCVQPGPRTCATNITSSTPPELLCDVGQRCEAGQCKVLGWRSESGKSQIAPCALDLDCAGGQVCIDNLCITTAEPALCTSATSHTDCPGGAVCSDELVRIAGNQPERSVHVCRPAFGFAECASNSDCYAGTCDTGRQVCTRQRDAADASVKCRVDEHCNGGERCEPTTGLCQQAAGESGMSEVGEAVTANFGKKIKLSTRYAEINGLATALLRVQVLSPQSASPIPPGAVVRLRMRENGSGATGQANNPVYVVKTHAEVAVKDLTSTAIPELVESDGRYERVIDGAFSPDGDRLLLVGISVARPILLKTRNLTTALDSERIIAAPVQLNGLRWVRQERFYACNWVGGYQHLQNKRIMHGLRGGLDDLRIHSGLRAAQSFRSEAERGFEFLVRDGRDADLDSLLPSCGNSHSECPDFHLCVESECQMVQCDPTDPWSCAPHGGRCTLRPESVEQENTNSGGSTAAWDWVCAADCNTDNQCFTEACLNGPCRFCETGSQTCIECRDAIDQVGELSIAVTEGCPDQRSFACEAGACITDCYSFEDDISTYLCDPTTEYCDRGRCVLLDWDWWDLAPASFSGGGEMRLKVPPDNANGWNGYTQAVDQRVPIEIRAYGVEDWLRSPEMVVEARGGPFFSSDWHRIAKISVHHRTKVAAQSNPYLVTSPYPFNDLRMRLVTSPRGNPTAGATGLRQNDIAFCVQDYLENVRDPATGNLTLDEGAALAACSQQAQGSRYLLGHAVGVPEYQAIAHCKENNHAGCPSVSNGEHDYLQGGQPAIAVLDVKVDGGAANNNITSNKVCSFQGTAGPPVDNGAAKKLTYGPFGQERSHQADALRFDCSPSAVPADAAGIWTGDNESAARHGDAGDGVTQGVTFARGKVGGAFAFDDASDHMRLPPDVAHGASGITFETWLRTGDLAGGIVSLGTGPESCAAWQERGQDADGAYVIWVGGRAMPVHCQGMDGNAPAEYIDLAQSADGANTASYAAGARSFGTPLRTTYGKLRFDPVTMTIDLGDQGPAGAFVSDNGGRLGDDCVPGVDAATTGCVEADANLQHLWRAEYDGFDTSNATMAVVNGVGFETGRVGQGFAFDGRGGYVRSSSGLAALPDTAIRAVTAEAWVRLTGEGTDVLIRQGPDTQTEGWELSAEQQADGTWLLVGTVSNALSADSATEVRGALPLAADTWHHVGLVIERKLTIDQTWVAVRLYANGALDTATETPRAAFRLAPAPEEYLTSELLTGAITVGVGMRGANALRGTMDEVGVWSRALEVAELKAIFDAGARLAAEPGHGDGKCLSDEIAELDICDAGKVLTTLPFGVAYDCLGVDAISTTAANIDLRGTPYAIRGEAGQVFAPGGTFGTYAADLRSTGQVAALVGGGDCGYAAPAGFTAANLSSPLAAGQWLLPVKLLDSTTGVPTGCADGDCVSDVMTVRLTPTRDAGAGPGLEVQTYGNRYDVSAHGLVDFGWHHVAVVWATEGSTAGLLSIYVDGTLAQQWSDTPRPDFAPIDRIVVGQDSACAVSPADCADTEQAFRGRLDELAFYARALTDSEIAAIHDAGARGRPLDPERPLPVCPDDDDGLIEFDRGVGYALLNCNYYTASPTGDSAAITLQNIVIRRQWPAAKDAIILDDGDVCIVELDPVRTQPCYAWHGSDVSLDGGNDAISTGSYVPFETLEIGIVRSFGHDEGFHSLSAPRKALTVDVKAGPMATAEQVATCDPSTTIEIGWEPSDMGTTRCFGIDDKVTLVRLAEGRTFQAGIVRDPIGWRCAMTSSPVNVELFQSCATCISGRMPAQRVRLDVTCEPELDVAVAVTFKDDGDNDVTPVLDGPLVLGGEITNVATDTLRVSSASSSQVSATFARLNTVASDRVTIDVVTNPPGYACTFTTANCAAVGRSCDVVTTGTPVALTCRETDTFDLTVSVTCDGAAGACDGLELENTGLSGAPVTIANVSDGTQIANLAAGGTWSIEIAGQPTIATCEVTDNATGTMPDAGLDEAITPTIACTEDTNIVQGDVLGLVGTVVLKLRDLTNGEEWNQMVTQLEDVAFPPEAPFSFPIPLPDGADFELSVITNPMGQTCLIGPTDTLSSTTPLPGGLDVAVSCSDNPEPTYQVSGSISGLNAAELVLVLNGGGERQDIPANATSFAFDLTLMTGTDYTVTVDRQPLGLRCAVLNGAGIIADTHVDNVQVVCDDATIVRVAVTVPGGRYNSRVRAFLYRKSPGASLVAQNANGDDGEQLAGASLTFDLALFDPDDPGDPDAKVAEILSGDYALMVQVSNFLADTCEPEADVDDCGGVHQWSAGASIAAWHEFTLGNDLPAIKVVNSQPSSATVQGQLQLLTPETDPPLPSGKKIVCAWTPAGTATPAVPFEEAGLHIVGFTSADASCKNDDGDSVDCPATVLTVAMKDPIHAALPLFTYLDVTCWLDTDSDMKLSTGDRYGRRQFLPALGIPWPVPLFEF